MQGREESRGSPGFLVKAIPSLRDSGQLSTLLSTPPAAPCWAKLSRAYGAGFSACEPRLQIPVRCKRAFITSNAKTGCGYLVRRWSKNPTRVQKGVTSKSANSRPSGNCKLMAESVGSHLRSGERYTLSNCSSRVSAHIRSRYYTVKDGPMVARVGPPPIRDFCGDPLNQS